MTSSTLHVARPDVRGDVVVGVDGSGSATAVALGRAEARARGRSLWVLHAWTTPVWLSSSDGALPDPEDCAAGAARVVDAAAVSLEADSSGLLSRAAAIEGEAGRVLVQAGEQAALLVVGGHPAGGPVGPTTTALLQRARCPVLVAHVRGGAPPYGRVVVGLDGVDSSHAALSWAAHAAVRHDRPLLVLHAWSSGADGGARQAQAQALLEREVDLLLPTRPPGTELRAAHGETVRTLLDEVAEDDLLVVGVPRPRASTTVPVRSVAVECALHARGPLAVVPEGWRST